MYTYSTEVRVRYAETDQMGFVYHGNYLMYYEIARTESLRNLGIAYKELEAAGIMLPVLDFYCKFYKPARYDDVLTVKVSIPQFPGVKIHFTYEIFNQHQELINTGNTILVFLSKDSEKPVRLPEQLKKVLEPYYV
ncbi:MAG: acyl-CoA thioesterase [Bacteroidota bacterium]|nr:acyl-CoA thioesterase [Bacteroidota bacterium]